MYKITKKLDTHTHTAPHKPVQSIKRRSFWTPHTMAAAAAHMPLPRSGPASVASASSMASSASSDARLKEAAANAIMRAKMEAAEAAKAAAAIKAAEKKIAEAAARETARLEREERRAAKHAAEEAERARKAAEREAERARKEAEKAAIPKRPVGRPPKSHEASHRPSATGAKSKSDSSASAEPHAPALTPPPAVHDLATAVNVQQRAPAAVSAEELRVARQHPPHGVWGQNLPAGLGGPPAADAEIAAATSTISELRARLSAVEAAYADAVRRLDMVRAAVM